MEAKKLHEKSTDELNDELLSLLREQFNLRMQATRGKLKKSHLMKKVRRNIARAKTIITEKARKIL